MFPGFKERLQSELKKIVPQKYADTMTLKFSDKAQDFAWLGTRAVALDGSARVVERKDWEEKGSCLMQ
jgi:actin-related protein